MEISTPATRPQAPPAPQAPVVSQQTDRVSTDLPEARTVTAVTSLGQTRPRSENNRTAQAIANVASPPIREESELHQSKTFTHCQSIGLPIYFQLLKKISLRKIRQNSEVYFKKYTL